MNPVILISSCNQDMYRGCHEAIRLTWGARSVIPYYFLLGNTTQDPVKVSKTGEVRLPVPDDYNSLPLKTREGHRWARKQGYDYIFQCFVDTYCFTKRMLLSGFEKRDYTGLFRGEGATDHLQEVNLGCYACGGSGYWLSPRATDVLITEEPDHWAEDLWVGRVMAKYGFRGVQDYRYRDPEVGYLEEALAIHLILGTGKYGPGDMWRVHRVAQQRKDI